MSVTTVDLQALQQMSARRRQAVAGILLLGCLGVLSCFVAIVMGAVPIAPRRVLEILLEADSSQGAGSRAYDANLILNIRLPRVMLGFEVGAALAVSGALTQGLFRNPLADPGLIGVSSGAGFTAAATIVLGGQGISSLMGYSVALPFGAFVGGLSSTLVIYAIPTRRGRTSVATMLLAGVGFGAFCGALTGLLATSNFGI